MTVSMDDLCQLASGGLCPKGSAGRRVEKDKTGGPSVPSPGHLPVCLLMGTAEDTPYHLLLASRNRLLPSYHWASGLCRFGAPSLCSSPLSLHLHRSPF